MCVSSYDFKNGSYSPSFKKQVVVDNLDDGYWIEAFQPDHQTPVGFIAYGLARGEVNFHPNPYTNSENTEPSHIQKLITPVGMDQADINGDGFKDVIICFDYGNTIRDFNPDGGRIVWLENPGNAMGRKPWKKHYVGKSPAMHRLNIGHFTQTERWEIIGLPVVNGPFDVSVPVLLFRQPDNVLTAESWNYEIIDNEYFHLIHDATKINIHSLDQLVLASREGINWLYYNPNSDDWVIEKLGDGEQGEKQQTDFYGSGGVDIGKVGNDNFAYIAALEPFHGNVVSVYTKSTNNSLSKIQWKRYALDVYGYPNENGEGTSHYVVCGDFDNDGDDEFLVALRGPAPDEGVYYYKPIDISRGLFSKWKVSDESASRIAIADYNNDTFLDFATISYNVRGYYLANNPSINTYYNQLGSDPVKVQNEIQVTKQNDEILFTVPRPSKVLQYQTVPFLTMGGINLSLEVLPPYSSRHVGKNTYIKVLSGMINWIDSSNKSNGPMNQSRAFLCEPKSVCSLEVHSDDNRIKTGSEGALFVVLQMDENMHEIPQFKDIRKVLIENSLPDNSPQEARKVEFKFIKVDELEWGKEKFKGLEFYNMKGFDIKFGDNNEHLCYMQFWAAGKGTNAGVHNHNTDRFCEVHACIVNGNGNSGMHYLKSSEQSYDSLTTSDSEFVKLVVPSFYEHGPLWDINVRKEPVLRKDGTVVYPWHKWQSGGDDESSKLLCKETRARRSLNVDDSRDQSTNKSLPRQISKRHRCASVSKQSFDVWIAFEFNPQLSKLLG